MSRLIERKIPTRLNGCQHPERALRAVRASNGAVHVATACLSCEALSSWYGKRELAAAGVDLAVIPIERDYSAEDMAEPCVVCGSRIGVEFHHFAPQTYRAYFSDPVGDWPVLPLCGYHHDEWHRVVTPELVSHRLTLGDLGGRKSMTIRELLDVAREYITTRRRKSA